MEIYKVIQEYQNYSVSNLGNIINNKTNKPVKKFDNLGYEIVSLFNCSNHKSIKVHRLVASVFIPNPLNKRCVDHIDNNKKNNNVSNLRWATHQENCRNRVASGKSGIKGVYKFMELDGKTLYNVYIGYNYNTLFLGCFDNIEEAKQVRMKKANELFGEFTNSCEKILSEIEILDKLFTEKFGN